MSLRGVDLHLRLGNTQVLRGVSISAQPGEMTAILGPNGSGKTSLLRLLAAELRPNAGEVLLGDRPIRDLPPEHLAKRRAVLPQASALAFPFTVAEIVALGGTVTGAAGPERIAAALARVGLAGFGGRLYQLLSGGQQQRVQLARVLVQVWHPVDEVGQPRWLLLDEPVSSLDIRHQLDVMQIAADYARQGGGVLAVLHDLNLTAMFADQAVLLSKGQIVAAGRPGDVLRNDTLASAYDCPLRVNSAPDTGVWLLPQSVRAND